MSRKWHNNRGIINMQIQLGMKIKSFIAAFVLIGMAACSATYTNHGYVPSEVELQNVIVGADSRATVEEVIGRPSSTGVLSDGAWYYISSRIRYYTYNKPEVIERTILAISFDENDTVTNIERFGLEDGKVVPFSRRVTDTGVRGTTFFSQLVRNLGNFSAGQLLDEDS
jgi:outer membrane protein assembly factor BamE (lipoprotein component of BamABCDE complex)